MVAKIGLRIEALGEAQVLLTVGPASGRVQLKTTLTKALLHYYLEKRFFTRDELYTTFWSHLTYQEQTNVFHVTKRQIAAALEEAMPGVTLPDLVVYRQGVYYLNDADFCASVLKSEGTPHFQVSYDVVEFETSAQHLLSQDQTDIMDWIQVIGLHGAGYQFLPGIEHKWVEARRHQLRDTFIELLMKGAGAAADLDPHLAWAWYSEAAQRNILRDDAHRGVMQMYATLGLKSELPVYYQAMSDILMEKHSMYPARETEALYNQLMADS